MFPAWFLGAAVHVGLVMIGGSVVVFLVLLYRDSRSQSLW